MNNLPDSCAGALVVHALNQLKAHPQTPELKSMFESIKRRCCNKPYMCGLTTVFLLRYTRGILNILGNFQYRPMAVQSGLMYKAADITVVLPTTDIMSATIHRVMRSMLVHPVKKIVISTAGPKAHNQAAAFADLFRDERIVLIHREGVSRREQTAHAMEHVDTALMILQDDHTYWPKSNNFLPLLLVPFEKRLTGAVSVVLEARHRQHHFSWAGFWNFLGMTYLTRRRYEYCATSALDGGISTLSGRFGVFRTEIYASPRFLEAYLNERVFFGMIGPLNVDDDKFHSRWLADNNWHIELQAGPETTMATELGEWPKFNEQVLRWTRTTCRSNPRQVLHRMSWLQYPYTTFSLLVWFTRMSLIQEGLMFWFLRKTLESQDSLDYYGFVAIVLYFWVTSMKLIKIFAHFRNHPTDIVYFPGYLVFGYWCTLVKLWACLTWWNASWATEKVCYKPTTTKSVADQKPKEGEPQIEAVVHPSPKILKSRPHLHRRDHMQSSES